jgi:hypothetical protein
MTEIMPTCSTDTVVSIRSLCPLRNKRMNSNGSGSNDFLFVSCPPSFPLPPFPTSLLLPCFLDSGRAIANKIAFINDSTVDATKGYLTSRFKSCAPNVGATNRPTPMYKLTDALAVASSSPSNTSESEARKMVWNPSAVRSPGNCRFSFQQDRNDTKALFEQTYNPIAH